MTLIINQNTNSYSEIEKNKFSSIFLHLLFISLLLLVALYLKSVLLLFLITFLVLLLKEKEILLLFIFLFSRFNGFGIGSIDNYTSFKLFAGMSINLGDFVFILLVYYIIYNPKKLSAADAL